jgi:exodeoxyribonuclease VII small subunit
MGVEDMPDKPVFKSLFDIDIDGEDEPQTGIVAATDITTGESKDTKEVIKMVKEEKANDKGVMTADALDDFEVTFDRLKAIVEELEREDIKLGEMVRLFEEGVGLIKKCDTYLKDARERVGKYIERGDDGKWIIKGLDAEE